MNKHCQFMIMLWLEAMSLENLYIPSLHRGRWAALKRFGFVFRVHSYLTKALSRTQLVSLENPWAVEYLTDLFRLIPIGCSRVLTCWIWTARLKNGSKVAFRSICTRFLTRGISLWQQTSACFERSSQLKETYDASKEASNQ